MQEPVRNIKYTVKEITMHGSNIAEHCRMAVFYWATAAGLDNLALQYPQSCIKQTSLQWYIALFTVVTDLRLYSCIK